MEDVTIAIGLGIFGLSYFGYCIHWMTKDIENKIKEQTKEIKELKQTLFSGRTADE